MAFHDSVIVAGIAWVKEDYLTQRGVSASMPHRLGAERAVRYILLFHLRMASLSVFPFGP